MAKVKPQHKNSKGQYVCPMCGHNRFKTVYKGSSYECRECRQVVAVDPNKFNKRPVW